MINSPAFKFLGRQVLLSAIQGLVPSVLIFDSSWTNCIRLDHTAYTVCECTTDRYSIHTICVHEIYVKYFRCVKCACALTKYNINIIDKWLNKRRKESEWRIAKRTQKIANETKRKNNLHDDNTELRPATRSSRHCATTNNKKCHARRTGVPPGGNTIRFSE